MSASEEFRRNAADCQRGAERAPQSDVRETLLAMAQRWTALAERMEHFANEMEWVRQAGDKPSSSETDADNPFR